MDLGLDLSQSQFRADNTGARRVRDFHHEVPGYGLSQGQRGQKRHQDPEAESSSRKGVKYQHVRPSSSSTLPNCLQASAIMTDCNWKCEPTPASNGGGPASVERQRGTPAWNASRANASAHFHTHSVSHWWMPPT